MKIGARVVHEARPVRGPPVPRHAVARELRPVAVRPTVDVDHLAGAAVLDILVAAAKKAQRTGEALFERTRAMLAAHGLAEYSETRIEVLGGRQSFAPGSPASTSLEVVLKLSAKHRDRRALELFAREFAPAATSMAMAVGWWH